MAVDKLVDSTQLDADLTSVANAIRTKGGTSAQLAFPADFLTAIAAIPSGGGGSVQYKTGTFTPTQTYDDTANVLITNIATIGFTPKLFLFFVNDIADVSGVAYAMLETLFHNNAGNYYRTTVRYSNTSNTRSGHAVASSWTSTAAYYLYFNNDNIYYRTYSTFKLMANVEYAWIALGW